VDRFIINELFEHLPVLLIQAGDVISVDVGEAGFNHGNCPYLSARPCREGTVIFRL
jgi:hypothetical protein